jgi:transcriptional regulator of arginine metabolism
LNHTKNNQKGTGKDMKISRQSKIIELINKYDIETQEELAELLMKDGYNVTQATVSRDIRELKLTKVAVDSGKQKYIALQKTEPVMSEKLTRVLREGFVSMDAAQNILVIKTVSGMAMAVAAALDALQISSIVGCIAGDDTIMCAVRTAEATVSVMEKLNRLINSAE